MGGVMGERNSLPLSFSPIPLGRLIDLPLFYLHTALFTQAQDSANYLCIIDEDAVDLSWLTPPPSSLLSVSPSSPLLIPPTSSLLSFISIVSGAVLQGAEGKSDPQLLQIKHQRRRKAAAFHGCSGSAPRGFQ